MFKRRNRKNAQAVSAAARIVVESLETRTMLSGDVEAVDAVLRMGDGSVFLAGHHAGSTHVDLVHFNANGTLDTAFGTGGRAEVSFGGNDQAIDLAADADGNIYVGGITDATTLSVDFAVARVSSAGVQDSSFGSGGAALVDFGGGTDVLKQIIVQGTGASTRVIAVGSTTNFDIYSDMAVAQVNNIGGVDYTTTNATVGVDDAAVSVVPAGDDYIVGVGASDFTPGYTIALTKYDSSGQIVTSFGGGTVNFVTGSPSNLISLTTDDAGNVLAVARVNDNLGTQLAVARYSLTDGSGSDTFVDDTIFQSIDVQRAGFGGGGLVVSGQAGTSAKAARYVLGANSTITPVWQAAAPFANAGIERLLVDADVASDGSVVLGANIDPNLQPGAEFDYQAQLITAAGAPSTIYSAGFGDTTPTAQVINGVLTVTGDAAANTVTVTRNAAGDYVVTINTVPAQTFTFSGSSVTSISIDGGDGNDIISVSSAIGISAVINGGAGADKLTGGSGNDLLLGGAGDDSLYGSNGSDAFDGGDGNDLILGGNGRDVLVGGDGSDTIAGNNGDDLLIAGIYQGNTSGLLQLVGVWNGGGSYASRVSTLQNGLLNGTVSDDHAADWLAGNNGNDLFVTDTGDWVLDAARKESIL